MSDIEPTTPVVTEPTAPEVLEKKPYPVMGPQKAVILFITNLLIILSAFGIDYIGPVELEPLGSSAVALAISFVVTPLIVYFVPNKLLGYYMEADSVDKVDYR